MSGLPEGLEPGSGSPMFCDHANEVPCSLCTCPAWCYCATRTCKLQFLKPDDAVTETGRASYTEPIGQIPRNAASISDDDFGAHVAATETRADGTVGGLDYCLLKLAAEAGEVAGLRGKEILAEDVVLDPYRRGDEHTARLISIARRARYALEIGDVLWYLTEACRLLGLTVDQVKALNIMKLTRRREPSPVSADGKRPRGKDPDGEQREAERLLAGAASTAERAPTNVDEYGPCDKCGDVTRHRLALAHRCVPCGGAR